MAPPDTIWHKESLKLKEIFGTREGFEICPNQFFHRLIKAPPGIWVSRHPSTMVCTQGCCSHIPWPLPLSAPLPTTNWVSPISTRHTFPALPPPTPYGDACSVTCGGGGGNFVSTTCSTCSNTREMGLSRAENDPRHLSQIGLLEERMECPVMPPPPCPTRCRGSTDRQPDLSRHCGQKCLEMQRTTDV